MGGEYWDFLTNARVPEWHQSWPVEPESSSWVSQGRGDGQFRLTCVSPSLLQGTLIQHLKEHVLHGNMTSSDILLYYTTVCPAASCCSSGAAWYKGWRMGGVSTCHRVLPLTWSLSWVGSGVLLSSLERFQKDLAVFLGWHTCTSSYSFLQCLGPNPGPQAC